MSDPDVDAAVAAALSSNWRKAIEINDKILAGNPADTDCLNRLGKAYLELGQLKKAESFFRAVLKKSRYDSIASKNLSRIASVGGRKINYGHGVSSSLSANFLEEPGKTRVITLVNCAPQRRLLGLNYTDRVNLVVKRHSVLAENLDGEYLGGLPDDLGHRLMVLIKGGNRYEAYVKSVSKNSLTVFIRETVRARKFKNTPSFSSFGSDYLSFVREEPGEENRVETESEDEDQDDEHTTTVERLHQDEELEEA